MSELEHDPIIHLTNEKLRRLGVKAVLFDLDDTLINTNEIFAGNMTRFSEAVAASLGLDSAFVLQRLRFINNDEYQRHGIDPKKWSVVLGRLAEELGSPETVQQYTYHIDRIYTQKPNLFPGVRAMLSGLKVGRFNIGEVTHGETEWSLRKNDQAGITHFFDVIVTADVRGPKLKDHWLQAMSFLSVLPRDCLIVGDNIKGDIIPATEVGSRAISLTSPWSIYREGELPQEAIQIKKISDFWDAVQKLS